MINGAELAQGLKDRLLSYMTSALPIGNHESQRFLGQRFFEAWQQGLFKGPFFETIPPYDRLESMSDKFSRTLETDGDKTFSARFRPKYSWPDVDHKFPFARSLRDRIWDPDSRESDLEESTTTHQALWGRGLFRHQWDAFNRAVYKKQNLVVATGTGSGKTECFQLPILYRLLTEPNAVREQRGVRALLVYPLNALVEDQSMRLRRLLFWLNLQFHEAGAQARRNHQITFGRYTGDTPVHSQDFGRKEPQEALKGLGELVYREEMQSSPPDILITNFTMLEYMLLREDDRQLFANPKHFSFIVLDEVHTYSGTQGMEVAMLLRRLKGFLESRAGQSLPIQCIGTSATLGGKDPRNEAAKFASTLFGTKFESENIVLGSSPNRSAVKDFTRWKRVLTLVSEESKLDALGSISRGEELSSDSHLWKELADSLGVPPSAIQESMPSSERLGTLFVHSGFAEQVGSLIENSTDSCIDLDSLADILAAHVPEPKKATGQILALLSCSTYQHEPVLAIRTHLFINEAKSGQLCLNHSCQAAPGGTDAWWRQLYIAHHISCDLCNSYVYPLLLCRRCGFVYLEGWRFQTALAPERDSAEKPDSYERWLFRPVDSDLPESARESGGARTLCLHCGRHFVGREDVNFATSQETHKCKTGGLLDIWVWRATDLPNEQLENCLFCEQHWVTGEEVITRPAPSTYAVSTLLLEELKRQFTSSSAESKIVSFSDTRQQAAQLALRLQGTNRDFTFRQMIYENLDERGSDTEDLIERLYDYARRDTKIRFLMAPDPSRPQDNSLLREQLSTLLYREAVTAYLTLEAQGLSRIQYPFSLYEAAKQTDISSSRILRKLSEEEKENWLTFLFDWGLRYVRYAMGYSKWAGSSLNFEKLKEWNIYPKNAALFSAPDQVIVGFLIKQRNKRNTLFNFTSRLSRQGFKDANELDLEDFYHATRPLWESVLASPSLWVKDSSTSMRPVLNGGGVDPDRCLIQLNFSSLRWRKIREDESVYRCDHCGRLAPYSIREICPIRDCRGTLRKITQEEIDDNEFSPVRHYRRLVRSTTITPLRVEEHTAQVSPTKRNSIEREFRSTAEDSIDVICGSTTFELGIDLGALQSVFMSNLPPRAANYRQRAGRAGRRPGAQPFVLNYVRQRPHDQYFWKAPQSFIAGPLPIPRLSVSSKEVISRHISAILVGRLLELYKEKHPGRFTLSGPPAGGFVEFVLSPFTGVTIKKELEPPNLLAIRLDHFLKGVDCPADRQSSWRTFLGRLNALKETYLALHEDEGSLDVLSDHGILPSYAFPIYVDELRLREYPLRESPRADLKLQRDRSIALREYSPGSIFVAGKNQILSEGVWQGYETKNFTFCPHCAAIDFRSDGKSLCRCNVGLIRKKALIPSGGFFGRVIRNIRESLEQTAAGPTDVYFDPVKEDPPPETRTVGRGLTVATLDARKMLSSRMRMFNPRPSHDGLSMAKKSLVDAASPYSPPVSCLERVSDPQAEQFYLMHEFTTDILQLRFAENEIGHLLLNSPFLSTEIHADVNRRDWLHDSVWFTLATSLALSGSQILDIDPTEIAVVLRRSHQENALGNREIILYDTTAGGAGYTRQLGEKIQELLLAAAKRLSNCDCQDSCYACLRTYYNQTIHARLHRKRVAEGLSRFALSNFL